MTTSRVAKIALHYITKLNFALTPIRAGTKAPYRDKWQHSPIVGERAAIDHWHVSTDGIGLVHHQSRTAALDIDDLANSHVALKAIGVDLQALLTAGVGITSGRPNRAKRLYRLPEGADFKVEAFKLMWPHPEEARRKITVFELRAGLVQDVLPPSIHPETKAAYRWEPACPRVRGDIPMLPPELQMVFTDRENVEVLLKGACPWAKPALAAKRGLQPKMTAPPDPPPSLGAQGVPLSERLRLAQAYVDRQEPAIEGNGGFDHTWSVVLNVVRGLALDVDDARPVLATFNARCVPPWDSATFEKKLVDAHDNARVPLGFMLGGRPKGTAPAAPAGSKSERPLVIGSEPEVADLVLAEVAGGQPIVFTRGEFFVYSPIIGVFERIDLDRMRRLIQMYDGILVGEGKKARALKMSASFREGAVTCAMVSAADKTFFDAAARGFAFRNVFVRVDAAGIHAVPHAEAHRARDSVPHDFDPAATCPKFLLYLDQVFPDVDTKEKIRFVREFIGAALIGVVTRFELAAVFVGKGANGKGVLLDVCEKLFPSGTVVSISPREWSDDYRLAMLEPARFNLVAELPRKAFIEGERFREVVSGNLITARQIRQAPIQFHPSAAHAFSTNELPPPGDYSFAFFRRLAVIEFNRSFTPPSPTSTTEATETTTTTARARDRDELVAELVAETPGIMLWALQGAVDLLVRGHFLLPASHYERLRRWRLNVDPTSEFLAACTDPAGKDAWMGGQVLWTHYTEWARGVGYEHPLPLRKFGERLKELIEWKRSSAGVFYAVTLVDADKRRSADA